MRYGKSLRERLVCWCVAWVLLVACLGGEAVAVEFSWEIESGVRFNFTKNGLDYSKLTFDEDLIGGSLLFGISGELALNKFIKFSANFDIGELGFGQLTSVDTEKNKTKNLFFELGGTSLLQTQKQKEDLEEAKKTCQDLGLSAKECEKPYVAMCRQQARQLKVSEQQCLDPHFLLAERLFFAELYATFYFHKKQWIKLDVGIYGKEIGRAVVMDAYVLGIRFVANLKERGGKAALPLRFEFDAFFPNSSFSTVGKRSPVLNLEASYILGEDQSIGLFATYRYDGDGQAGPLLYPQWQDQRTRVLNTRLRDAAKNYQTRTGEKLDVPVLSCDDPTTYEQAETALADVQAKCENAIEAAKKACRNNATCLAKAEEALNRCPVQLVATNYDNTCSGMAGSNGHHFWVGLQGNKTWGKLTVEGSAILYFSFFNLYVIDLLQPPSNKRKSLNRSSVNQNFNQRLVNAYQECIKRGYSKSVCLRRVQLASNQQPLSSSPLSTLVQPQTTASEQVSQRGLAFHGELKATYKWTKHFWTGLFFLYAMGDRWDENKNTLNSFIGVAPQLRYTDIFFNGGINAHTATRQISLSGVAGRGYIVPGVNIHYYIEEKVDIKLTGAVMFSQVPHTRYPNSQQQPGRLYGLEFNLNATYNILPWLQPVLQADVFLPGNFYYNPSYHASPKFPVGPVLFQIYAGFNFSFSSG